MKKPSIVGKDCHTEEQVSSAEGEAAHDAVGRRRHHHQILLLQGGGALGAYQAGAYEGLAEAGILPDWVVGVSMGSINAALIAGNLPERRVERLRAFWDRVSEYAPLVPPAWLDFIRPAFNRASAAAVVAMGVPGFFVPRVPNPFFAPDGSLRALSVYDTEPLDETLKQLVDFDLINRQEVRLSLGAVNVQTGDSVYFDSQRIRLRSDHVRASGALPPGLPPVTIDGEHYWDGGIVSNSPLWYVFDELPQSSALIIQIDLFSASGDLPRNLDEVQERAKDIQYSSKARFNTHHVKHIHDLRAALGRLLGKLPPELMRDPDVRELASLCETREITVAHLINHRRSGSGQTKDYDFSRATVCDLWNAGLEDVRRRIANAEWIEPTGEAPCMHVHYLPSDGVLSRMESRL
jgi:NTE family protein